MITPQELADLKNAVTATRERPPAAGMFIRFHCDMVERIARTIEKGAGARDEKFAELEAKYADLYALNQQQADKIAALSAEIERLKNPPPMGDDVVGDAPQS